MAEQPQAPRQTRVHKEKSKKSGSQEAREAEQEQLDAEFNAAADRQAEKTRDRIDALDKETSRVLAKIDSAFGL